MNTETVVGGLIVASFAALLGYVMGNRGNQQLKIDIAMIAPSLATINQTLKVLTSGLESVSRGFINHLQSDNPHPLLNHIISDLKGDVQEISDSIHKIEQLLTYNKNDPRDFHP